MRTTTAIIGAGHAGLAMSRCLTARSIDHVVLERGEVACSWAKRWQSLRLLTPNWQMRLPGHAYAGNDPDGFMGRDEVARFIRDYATRIAAPVHTQTEVTSVSRATQGYAVATNQGIWQVRSVVLASGASTMSRVPPFAGELPRGVCSVPASRYSSPDELPQGGVLVVGASATGVQLALELQRSGRPVTLAVGHHVRMPRRYRGRDVQWWLHRSGQLDTRYDEVDDLRRARAVPSPQLIGQAAPRAIDLNLLSSIGVRLVGKMAGLRAGRALFSGSLRNCCQLADLKQQRMLSLFDRWASSVGLDGELAAPERPPPTAVPQAPKLDLDLEREGIKTVLWATGFRPDYSYLQLPVFDGAGRVRHEGGVVAAPGLYLMGTSFMRRRKSSFIHGAGDDALDLAEHLAQRVASPRRPYAIPVSS